MALILENFCSTGGGYVTTVHSARRVHLRLKSDKGLFTPRSFHL